MSYAVRQPQPRNSIHATTLSLEAHQSQMHTGHTPRHTRPYSPTIQPDHTDTHCLIGIIMYIPLHNHCIPYHSLTQVHCIHTMYTVSEYTTSVAQAWKTLRLMFLYLLAY